MFVLVFFALILRENDRSARRHDRPDDPEALVTRPSPGARHAATEGAPSSSGASASSADKAEMERIARAITKGSRMALVDDAMRLGRFPPNSQQLTAQMTDVLKPYQRYESPQPLKIPSRDDPDGAKKVPWFLFSGNTATVFPGGQVLATLEAFQGPPDDDRSNHLPIELVSCRLTKNTGQAFAYVTDLPLNDQGANGDAQAGDLIFSAGFDPSTVTGLAGFNGMISIDAEFLVSGLDAPAKASVQFKIIGSSPATFTGVTKEALSPAGLDLTMGVNVTEPGAYVLQGLLFDANSKPIGYAVARPTFTAGQQSAVFSFFGLLFHEANAQAPYVLRTVTGYRLPAGSEPETRNMPTWSGEYRTRTYQLSDFSSDEYDSEDKAKRIAALQEFADQNPSRTQVQQGLSASPPPSPAPGAPPTPTP